MSLTDPESNKSSWIKVLWMKLKMLELFNFMPTSHEPRHQWELLTFDSSIMRVVILHSIGWELTRFTLTQSVTLYYKQNAWRRSAVHMRLNTGIAPTSGLGKKQWFGVAPGLNFVISVQGNDLVQFLYLAACRRTRGKRFIGYFVSGCFPLLFFCIFVIEFGAIRWKRF